MKRTLSRFMALVFAALALTSAPHVLSTAALAQAKPAVIAVIDTRRLFSESLVSKDIRSQLTQIAQTFGAEENGVKEKLLKEKDELDKQRGLLVQEAYEQKYADLQQRAQKLNRQMDLHQKQLNLAQARANRDLQKVLTPIISDVADKKGVTVVLEKAQIVYQTTGLDITTEVIELLDKKLPTLKVQLPTEAEIMELERQAQQGD